MTQFEELDRHLRLVVSPEVEKRALLPSKKVDFPPGGSTVDLAGDTVAAVRVTALNSLDPPTSRVEWGPAISSTNNRRVIYRHRWEGNAEVLDFLPPGPHREFLTEALE